MPRIRNHAPAIALSLLLTAGGRSSSAAEPSAAGANWRVGAAFSKELDQPVGLTWPNTPLGESLQRLAESTRVAVLLDRRVDPGRPVTVSVQQEPLRLLLTTVAEHAGQGATTLDAVAYIGPLAVARQLRTLSAMQHAIAGRAPAARKKALLARRAWSWPRFATPQSLLADLERESGVKIAGQEFVPHDLLRAADLPAIPWIDRLLLLAAQFGLRFELSDDGAEARLASLTDAALIARSYPAKGRAEAVAKKWRELAPEAEIAVEGERVVVSGRVEDHELVGHPIHSPGASDDAPASASSGNGPTGARSGQRPAGKTVVPGKQEYQLTVENKPLRQLLKQLGEKLNVEIDWDEAAIKASGRSLDTLVSFEIKGASLDELIEAAVKPAGFSFERNGQHIRVLPAAK